MSEWNTTDDSAVWAQIWADRTGDTVYGLEDYAARDVANYISPDEWIAQKNRLLSSPTGQQLFSKYGDEFLRLTLDALQNNWSSDEWNRQSLLRGIDTQVSASYGGGGATRAQQIAAAEAAIRNEAQRLGYVTFSDAQIRSLAGTAVSQNWSSEQLTDYLVQGATSNWDQLQGGALTGAVDSIKALAAQQLISVSDVTARNWAGRLMSGELDGDGLRSLLQQQATARYGWAADVIAQGISMQDFLAPSRDRIASILEVDPNELDLTDPKIQSMMTVTNDRGEVRVANDAELIRNARKDSRWVSTGNARELTAQAGMMLRRYVEGT
jgi:hypothetical protein